MVINKRVCYLFKYNLFIPDIYMKKSPHSFVNVKCIMQLCFSRFIQFQLLLFKWIIMYI